MIERHSDENIFSEHIKSSLHIHYKCFCRQLHYEISSTVDATLIVLISHKNYNFLNFVFHQIHIGFFLVVFVFWSLAVSTDFVKPENSQENKDKETCKKAAEYCKFGNFRESFIYTKLRICEVSKN